MTDADAREAAIAAFQALLRGCFPREEPFDPERFPWAVSLAVDATVLRVTVTDRGALHVSAPIFINVGRREDMLDTAVAAFNGEHLLSGGYCLVVHPQSLTLSLQQMVDLRRFEPASFRDWLADFSQRAVACARWYGALLPDGTGTPPDPASAKAVRI